MNQLHRFLEVCKEHADQLSVAQREEIANYLVPEVRVGCSSCLYRVTEGGNS